MSTASVLRIPASVGELYDKITILEIKAARMTEPRMLAHVTQELVLLRELEAECGSSNADHLRLVAELKRVNESLWDIEDAIRECEHRGDFGANFVALARSVYKTNDQRAALKKELNRLHGSAIVEEKSYSHGT
jgi:hypothetical protein